MVRQPISGTGARPNKYILSHLCIILTQDTTLLVPSHGGLHPILQTLNPTVWSGSFVAVCTVLYIPGKVYDDHLRPNALPTGMLQVWLIDWSNWFPRFRRGTGIDHAPVVVEIISGIRYKKWVEFRNLVEHNVPQPEIALFRAFYSSQSGAAHGSRAFNIQRGVKQVDILSPMFFNVVLEYPREPKRTVEHEPTRTVPTRNRKPYRTETNRHAKLTGEPVWYQNGIYYFQRHWTLSCPRK